MERYGETKSLLCKTLPVVRRLLGESNEITVKLLWTYAEMLYKDHSATFADLREAVNTLEDSARDTRRVYGKSHPFAKGFEYHLPKLRAAVAARETPPPHLVR